MKTKCAAILVAIATVYVAIAAGGKAIEPVPDFDHAPARRLCAHRSVKGSDLIATVNYHSSGSL